MYEWLKSETTDVRFILLVIFVFFMVVILLSAIASALKPQDFGPDPEPTPIKDGKGKHRDSNRKPDAPSRPYTPRQDGDRPQVRFVDEETLIDESTGEVLN